MNLLQKIGTSIAQLGTTKREQSIRQALRVMGMSAQWPTDDVQSFIEEGYQKNPWVYACVSLIAESFANLTWTVQRETADGWEDVEEGRLHEMMTVAPNDLQGVGEFLEDVASSKLITGEAFLHKIAPDGGPNAGQVQELETIRSSDVAIEIGERVSEPIEHYEHLPTSTELEPEEILHWKFYNPNNYWRGQSPMVAAVRAITQNNAYQQWNTALAQNMGKPGAILAMEEDPGEEGESQIKEAWRRSNAGPHNAGEPMLMGGLKEFIQTGINPVDADWHQGHIDSAIMVCIVYAVPPELVGIADQKTYSNVKEARQSLYTETVIPLADSFKHEMNRHVAPTYGDDLRVDYRTDDVEALRKDTKELVETLKDAWWLSPNERRERMGVEPAENPAMDQYWIPSTLLPAGDSEEEVTMEEAREVLEEAGVIENGSL